MWPVAAAQFLKTRVSPDIKERVQQAANRQLITESIWLKRLVIQATPEAASGKGAFAPGIWAEFRQGLCVFLCELWLT